MLWGVLRGLRKIYAHCSRPIKRLRWKLNKKAFDAALDKASKETNNFFVLQIGACDGVMCDPINFWIKAYRWQGLLVEPQRKEFERLMDSYLGLDGLKFENVAIADKNEERPLYKVREDGIFADWQRGLATLIPTRLDPSYPIEIEMVKCITFGSLLDKHRINRIDLLQIDVEGYDCELIRLFDFNRIRPKLIRYEHCHLRRYDRKLCQKLLAGEGYKIFEMQNDTGAILIDS